MNHIVSYVAKRQLLLQKNVIRSVVSYTLEKIVHASTDVHIVFNSLPNL